MRVLWLSRYLPYPLLNGERIYSGRLPAALAAAGAEVTVAGLSEGAPQPALPGLQWQPVPGAPRGALRALASPMPLVAGRYATPAYDAAVGALARAQRWDAVVLDHYAMGWVLRHRDAFPGAAFVFVAHDHVESVTRLQATDPTATPLRRLYLRQNFLKTRRHERRTVAACDLVTCITGHDAALFTAHAPGLRTLVLTPGYDGPVVPARSIDAATPRMVLMFGSYHWSAKQANLLLFLDQADSALADAGIELRIVGMMPEEFRQRLEGRYRSPRIIGFVDDPTPHLAAARIAVLAEPIGGGFKLKLLDYLFRRIPVAALDACAAGLPSAVRAELLLRPDIATLLPALIDAVDDLPRLNHMQAAAQAAAAGAFDWADRGRALYAAIAALRPASAAMAEAAALPEAAE